MSSMLEGCCFSDFLKIEMSKCSMVCVVQEYLKRKISVQVLNTLNIETIQAESKEWKACKDSKNITRFRISKF